MKPDLKLIESPTPEALAVSEAERTIDAMMDDVRKGAARTARLALIFFLVGLALLVAAVVFASTPRGGLIYGMPLEGIADKEAQVARYVDGLTVAIVSEANIASFPALVPTTDLR